MFRVPRVGTQKKIHAQVVQMFFDYPVKLKKVTKN